MKIRVQGLGIFKGVRLGPWELFERITEDMGLGSRASEAR